MTVPFFFLLVVLLLFALCSHYASDAATFQVLLIIKPVSWSFLAHVHHFLCATYSIHLLDSRHYEQRGGWFWAMMCWQSQETRSSSWGCFRPLVLWNPCCHKINYRFVISSH